MKLTPGVNSMESSSGTIPDWLPADDNIVLVWEKNISNGHQMRLRGFFLPI